MNIFKGTLDTRQQNGVIASINQFDNATLELKIVTDGQIDNVWDEPRFELIGMKRDNNPVREVDQDHFTILSKEEHKVRIELKEQFLTCRGTVKMQLIIKDGGRESTTIFYLLVGQSLDRDIIESRVDVKVLDDLETYIQTGREVIYDAQAIVTDLKDEMSEFNASSSEKEAERQASELNRASKELNRIDNEETRVTNEHDRVTNEEDRVTNEEERVANEQDRVTNEQNRRLAENTRIAQERARQDAELQRNSIFEENETIRKDGEKKRITNENEREKKFSTWEERETTRLRSEENRIIQEQVRVANEETRQRQEQTRQNQEDYRQRTYTQFNEAEVSRANKELQRQTAEENRVAAESNRQNSYADRENERDRQYAEAEEIRNNAFSQNEANRQSEYTEAERDRIESEELRKSRERDREAAESRRALAETERSNAESGRVITENKRAEAEQRREQSESERQKAENDRKNKITEFEEFAVETTERIEEQQSQIDNLLQKKEIEYYGVRFTGSSPTGQRLGNAIGLSANAGVDNQVVINAFDKIYPWSHIRRCNLSEDGKVLAYEGEPGYASDGSNGQVMVEIPKFYQYRDQSADGEIREYRISRQKLTNYWLNPRFIKSDGTELDRIYIGAYKASGDDSKLYSKSGVYPQVSINRQVARNRAKAIGEGWGIGDYLERNIIEFLFCIEFATLHSQSIMQGQVNFSQKNSVLAESGVNRVVFTNADISQYVVGQTVWIANSNRKVLAIETVDSNNKAIIVDGTPFDTTVGMGVDCRGWMCGSSDNVKATSGSLVSNSDGKHPFKYRGIESPWGDIWEWVDGVCIKDHQTYVATNPMNYADDKFVEPYQRVGFMNAEVDGYVKKMGYDYLKPYIALPVITSGAGTTTYYSDYYYQNTGNRAPFVGGSWYNGGLAGVSYWNCNYAWSHSYAYIGARLSYKPL